MTFYGINNCDDCGKPIEERQWLVGLCRACEMAPKPKKRPIEILEPTKGLVS